MAEEDKGDHMPEAERVGRATLLTQQVISEDRLRALCPRRNVEKQVTWPQKKAANTVLHKYNRSKSS